MGKTKRTYNKKRIGNSEFGVYHPYRQVCMGRCRMCRDSKNKDADVKRKRLKASVKRELDRW